MTEKELNGIHYINKEIKKLQEELNGLKSRSFVKGQELTGMPFGSGTSDKTGSLACAIRETEELIELKLKEVFIIRNKIERYISNINDSEVRLIVRLRCINCMDWEDIAAEMTVIDNKGNVIKTVHRTTVTRKFKNFLKMHALHMEI